MDFEANERGDVEGFLKKGLHVGQMGEHCFCAYVPFAAMRNISVEAETIVQTSLFLGCLRHETDTKLLEWGKAVVLDAEIGDDCAASIIC